MLSLRHLEQTNKVILAIAASVLLAAAVHGWTTADASTLVRAAVFLMAVGGAGMAGGRYLHGRRISDPSIVPPSGQDDTEHQRAVEALKVSQARFAGILDIAAEAIVSVDADQRIILFNKGAERIFGYTVDEVMGQPLDLLLPRGVKGPRHRALVSDFGAGPEASRTMFERDDVFARRKNGNEFPARVSISRLNLGTETVLTAILRDISWFRESQSALRAAKEEAESANRLKSQFLANMSHELRTPLNAILGFSELLIANPVPGPPANEKQRAYAQDINDAGTHLLQLINDILDLSKVESGNDQLHEAELDVKAVVRAVTQMMRARVVEAGIDLVENVPDHLPTLLADERKLKQVLVNLLSNAIKFTGAGGTVTIKAKHCRVAGYVFQVADTGIGMAPADIPKATSLFGQIDGKVSRRHAGTGLGLPLTKALVEQHGGTLEIHSALGVGTIISVEFPAARVASRPPNPAAVLT